MAERRQLPPQIRRVELARRAGSKPVVRYQLTVDTGIVDGKRKQLRRRYRTEKEARAALAEVQGQVNAGSYVQPSTLTVEQACADWLRSRHRIRPTTAAGYEYVLQPLRSELGALAVQDLTRRHIDDLIAKLRAGSLERPGGKARKAWSARSCNYMLGALSQVLAQLVAEGRLARNVAGLVDRSRVRAGSSRPSPPIKESFWPASPAIAIDMRGTSLLLGSGGVKSRACVGTMSTWPGGRCGSARPVSTSEVAPSTRTIRRPPQPAGCFPYPRPY